MKRMLAAIPLLVLLGVPGCDGADVTASSVGGVAAEAAAHPCALHPADFAAWKARHAAEGTTPEGALKVWLDATLLWGVGDEADRAVAAEVIQYLTIPLKESDNWPTLPTNRTFVGQMEGEQYIFRSYAVGATPENEYAMDPANWQLNVKQVHEPGPRGTRVDIVSGGADSPRPVYMKQSEQTGLWYLNVWANTYVGIRKPIPPGTETFR
jgi:hypothetical protein